MNWHSYLTSKLGNHFQAQFPHLIDLSTGKQLSVEKEEAAYNASGGYFDLFPTEELLQSEFGLKYTLWKEVQDNGIVSYQTRGPVGNFSHDHYSPGVRLGQIIRHTVPDRALVLDVGCGLLDLPMYLKMQEGRLAIVGIDPIANGCPEFYSPRQFPFVRAVGDLLPFSSSSFEAVIFSSTLDHHFDPYRAVREAYRVLKPGGHIFVVETVRSRNRQYWRWQFRQWWNGCAIYNQSHCWAFSARSLKSIIKKGKLTLLGSELVEPAELILTAIKSQKMSEVRPVKTKASLDLAA
jgi:ubiquinone/menaquinone biosynthesis C-methylase UbiE